MASTPPPRSNHRRPPFPWSRLSPSRTTVRGHACAASVCGMALSVGLVGVLEGIATGGGGKRQQQDASPYLRAPDDGGKSQPRRMGDNRQRPNKRGMRNTAGKPSFLFSCKSFPTLVFLLCSIHILIIPGNLEAARSRNVILGCSFSLCFFLLNLVLLGLSLLVLLAGCCVAFWCIGAFFLLIRLNQGGTQRQRVRVCMCEGEISCGGVSSVDISCKFT